MPLYFSSELFLGIFDEIMDFREIAKEYVKQGYSVLPVSESKQPVIAKWGIFQTRQMTNQEIDRYFKNCWGIGFICGDISSCIAVDFDTKNFNDLNLYEKIKEEVPNEILRKMYVQTTKNGGFHWVFKVHKDLIKGNQKLANRPTTPEEKDEVYREAYKNIKTRSKALKMAQNHKCLVMVETRETGGYILITPTPKYERVFGKIQYITDEEYEVLMSVLRSFNEYEVEETRSKMYDSDEWEISPFEDFNINGDVVGILMTMVGT